MFPQTSLLASALLLSTSASAFQQTSPFFLLSSTPFHQDSSLRSTQLSSAVHVLEGTLAALSNCDAELYLLVEQPGVSAEDFDAGNGMPNMRRRMMEGAGMYEAAAQIPEVIGGVDFEGLMQGVEKRCGGRRMGVEEYCELRSFPCFAEGGGGDEIEKVVMTWDSRSIADWRFWLRGNTTLTIRNQTRTDMAPVTSLSSQPCHWQLYIRMQTPAELALKLPVSVSPSLPIAFQTQNLGTDDLHQMPKSKTS
jgi:hypothetical protein